MELKPSQKQSLYTINCQSTPICTSPPWFRVSGMCPIINDSITNDQLIMRRKAEVLQHKNNSANLTKKQKWSQMVRTNVKLGAKMSDPGLGYCKYHSSASDVPGKIIDLYLDKRIQPWGVGPQRRSFAMGGLWTKLYAGPGYPRK